MVKLKASPAEPVCGFGDYKIVHAVVSTFSNFMKSTRLLSLVTHSFKTLRRGSSVGLSLGIILGVIGLGHKAAAAPGTLLSTPTPAVGNYAFGLSMQPNGSEIIVGNFTSIGGSYRPGIGRINADGTLDTTFTVTPSQAYLFSSTVQYDGKIVIGGFFNSVNGTGRGSLARLNADGTLDSTFNPNCNSYVISTMMQSNGQIVASGNFGTVAPNGGSVVNRVGMVRFNADGTLDTGFDPSLFGSASTITQQSDGKLIIGGDFSGMQPNGGEPVYVSYLQRLNTIGTLDTGFTPPQFNSYIAATAIQADGKILAGGSFTPYGGGTRTSITRLNTNGTEDSSFTPAITGGGVSSIAVQADGKILIGGNFTTVSGSPRNGMARLNSNGTLDTTFLVNSNANGELVLGNDGRIRATGYFTSIDGIARSNFARLENDLPIDTLRVTSSSRVEWLRGGSAPETQFVTFELSTNGGSSWTSLGAGVRIAGGWELTGLSLPGSGLVRGTALTPSGARNCNNGLAQTVEAFPFVAPNLVVEYSSNPLTNGGPDVAFGSLLTFNSTAPFVFTVRNTGAGDLKRLLVNTGGANQGDFAVTQLPVSSLSNGASATFSVVFTPKGLGSRTASIQIGSNDSGNSPFVINLQGTGLPSSNANLAALAITPNSLTPGFNAGTFGYTTNVAFQTTSLTVTPTVAQPAANVTVNGTPVASGASSPVNLAVGVTPITVQVTAQDGTTIQTYTINVTRAAATVTGDVDQTFNQSVNGEVFAAAYQLDGKLIIGGILQGFNGNLSTYYGLARLNANGSLDTSFDPQPFGDVDCILVLPNGKIVIAGNFTSLKPNGGTDIPRSHIALLNADGTVDMAFNPNPNSSILGMALDANGDILISGGFTALQPNGAASPTTRNYIARIHQDGTLDTSFNPNADAAVYGVTVQLDGKIIVCGNFGNIAGAARTRLARLNYNGTLDSSFLNYTADADIFTTVVQPDNSILVAGNKTGGSTSPTLARLLPNGALDNTFNPLLNSAVRTLVLQADGKCIAGGVFIYADLTPRFRVARFDAAGVLDANFNPNVEGPAGTAVHALTIGEDGKIIVGGYFNSVGGIPRNRIARLENTAPTTQTLLLNGANGFEWLRGGSAPEATSTTFELSTDGGNTWTLLGPGTRVAGGWQINNLNNLPTTGLVRGLARVPSGRFGASSSLFAFQNTFSIPVANIAVEQPEGNALTDGQTIDLGTLGANVPQLLSFKINNLGGMNLTSIQVTIDGTHKAMFTLLESPASMIESLDSDTFTVQVKVSGTGAKTATLRIASNDLDSPVFDVNLTATASAAVPPAVVTGLASAVTVDSATLAGTVDAKGTLRTVSFDYGLTSAYGSTVAANPATLSTSAVTPVSVTLSGLQPHTVYHYQVRAEGDLGAASGADKTFTTANSTPVASPDSFAIVPPSVILDVLANDTDADNDTLSVTSKTALSPTTAGTLSLTGGNLIFTPSATFSTATFSYTVKDGFGGTATSTVSLSAGSMSILPTTKQVTSGGESYAVTVTSTGVWSVSDALSWITTTPSSGDSSVTSLTITVAPNPSKSERSGSIKIGDQTHTITQAGVIKPIIGPMTGAPYSAIVGGSFSQAVPTQNGPVTYTASNLPPGLSLSNVTGIISGVPTKAGQYAVTVKAKNAAGPADDTLSFNINVLELSSGAVGTFQGLIDRQSTLNRGLASRLDLTTTAAGICTGKITTGTKAARFKGDLTADVNDPTLANFVIFIPTLNATLSLQFDGATDSLTGTLSDGGVNTAAVRGWRNAWGDFTDKAASVAGTYSFYLEQPDSDVTLPQGYGYGSFIVNAKTGALSINGKLADGTVLRGAAFVGQNGQILLYAPLYATRGSFAGQLTLTTGASAPLDNTLLGTPDWLKPEPLAKSTDTVYRAGFGPLSLNAAGSIYVAPGAGQRVLGVTAVTAPATNATLAFTLGGLEQEAKEFDQLLTISNPKPTGLTNKATIGTPVNSTAMPTLNAPAGLFGGSFNIAGTSTALNRPAPFSGQIVTTAAGGTQGYGFFLLPEIPDTDETVKTSPKLSGRVILKP